MTDTQPLFSFDAFAGDQAFAVYQGRVLSRDQLWADVRALAATLPQRSYVFNLCENRYLFCVCLLAALSRGQTCLLPPSGQLAVIEEIMQDYPDAYLAAENPPTGNVASFAVAVSNQPGSASAPTFDWQRPALIAFTSGSSGRPKPCSHNLSTFALSADMALRALNLKEQAYLVVSTTPPQHMYGLENSVFWPLFSKLLLSDSRPFFPEEVRNTVTNAAFPVLLTSTPTHLRAMTQSAVPWCNLAGILSATDNLPEELACQAEAILGQAPREIYGSTETLSFASRAPLQTALWQTYPGARLYQQNRQTWLQAPHLPGALALHDHIELNADGCFRVLGRPDDMLKVGGKRSSLSELNRRLLAIPGVEDGFCFLPVGSERLAAVVVSQLDKKTIRQALQTSVDEVFLPRKIHYVTAIPRNAAGKLPQAARQKLLAELEETI